MEDQFDEELKNRIKKVFDDYDDPAADEGWVQLRKKFPAENERRRALPLLWWSAAALLLLALGLGVWKYASNTTGQNMISGRHIKTVLPSNLQARKQVTPPVKSVKSPPPGVNTATNSAAAEQNPNGFASTNNGLSNVNTLTHTAVNPTKPAGAPAQQPNQIIAATNTNRTAGNKIAILPPTKPKDSTANTINQTANTQLAAMQTDTPPVKNTAAPSTSKPKNPVEMFAAEKVVTKTSNDGPRVRLGVYAASFVNYAKGSTNQTNGGAGFSAEIRIAKNLKVVTGLSLAKNSLSYNGGVPFNAVQSNLFAPAAYSNIGNGFPNAASYTAHAAITVASVPAFQNYGVSMFNLDIPVNLKYDFNPKKTSFYLMAGLSSGTFANETYTYYYNYPALPSPSLQAPHSLSSQKSFDNFYVGRMLNVAFGYGYPIGRNHLILEPFLKYPLGGVGSQNIRLGTGGINLKLNFPTK